MSAFGVGRVVAIGIVIAVSIGGCECGRSSETIERSPVREREDESAGGHVAEDGSRGAALRLREAGDGVPEPSRFEPVDPALAAGSVRARGWASMDDLRRGAAARMSLGNWLCRIWTHYGEPPQVQRDGFVYAFRDRETGDVITAYSAGSGPAMGALFGEDDLGGDGVPSATAQQRLTGSVDAFVALIDATEPRACELELDGDFGRIRVGVRGGVPAREDGAREWFEEEIQ
ncbi:MAG: hypothetical protein M3Y87_17885 [Myxococcota bacterium]|nr:hypothetical protein [Myxococcota bacterium]